MAGGAARGESRGGYWEGEPSESLNPMSGSGMKQGQEGRSGVRRHEAEKAWRRCAAGSGTPGVGRCSCLETL